MSHSESVPSTSSAHRGFEVLDAEHLDARLSAVREALRLCPTEVPASLSIPAHKALDAVARRLVAAADPVVPLPQMTVILMGSPDSPERG